MQKLDVDEPVNLAKLAVAGVDYIGDVGLHRQLVVDEMDTQIMNGTLRRH